MSDEIIYIKYVEKVRQYIRGKIQNPQDVEDLVSTVFEKVYQQMETFDDQKASFSTWIYTVTKNTVIDFYKKNRIHAELTETLDYQETGFEEILKNETLDELAKALERLDERQRDLIILHYYSGYTLKVIANKMGMSYVNAKVIHRKALRQLKELMGNMI